MKYIYYWLRHAFTGKHWYSSTWEWPVRDDEAFLTQTCRICNKREVTTHGEWQETMRKMRNMMIDQMMLASFKPIYTKGL